MHINNCADKIRSSTWLIVLKFKFKVRLLILFSDLNTNKIITKQQTELWTHQTSMNTPLICVQITFPTEKNTCYICYYNYLIPKTNPKTTFLLNVFIYF